MSTNRILKVEKVHFCGTFATRHPYHQCGGGTNSIVCNQPFQGWHKENKKHNFDRAIEEFTIAIEISSHLVNIVPERGFAPCLWRVKPNWIQLRKERP